MQKNVGGYDRIARLVLGIVLVTVGIAGYVDLVGLGVLGIPALAVELAAVLVGLVLLVTGVTETCPVNAALGIDTSRGAPSTAEQTDETAGVERPGSD